MSGYKVYELAEVCSRLSSGKGIPASRISIEGEFPVYGGNGLRGYTDQANFAGDCAIIGRQGAFCGNVRYFKGEAYMTEHAVVVCASPEHNTRYLSYLLSTMNLGRLSGQSAQPGLSVKTLAKQEVKMPSLEIQNRVALVLALLDEKIELNNTINENLLQQAIALFDNALQQSESISFVELGSLADVKGGKRLPKGVNLITKPNSHPYIRVRDLNNVIFASLSSDYAYVDDETQKSIARYITSAGDVLVSIVGTIGLTAIVDDTLANANLTENCVKLTNLKGITPEYLLLFLRSKEGIEAINKGTVGAVQLKLPIKNIQSIPVPLLLPIEMQALDDILSVIFNRISTNVIEVKMLSELRDTLLPKLISGELSVSKINY